MNFEVEAEKINPGKTNSRTYLDLNSNVLTTIYTTSEEQKTKLHTETLPRGLNHFN